MRRRVDSKRSISTKHEASSNQGLPSALSTASCAAPESPGAGPRTCYGSPSMRRFHSLALLVACVCACASSAPANGPRAPAGAAAPAPRIAFIEDDYGRALAGARATHRPLFVDGWAPWCHTCMSMREYVFPDPAMQRLAADFVWLSINTEKPENEPFLQRFPMRVMPTLWVIDPADEHPALKWLGSATVSELSMLLADAEREVQHGAASGEASAAFLRGKRALAEGRTDDAMKELRAALAAVPAGSIQRAQIVEALGGALDDGKHDPECVALASEELPGLPPGTSVVNLAENSLSCAFRLPKDAPERARIPALLAAGRRIAEDPAQPVLADDRSSLFEHVVNALDELGEAGDARAAADAKAVAREWSTFLDAEAARAPTPAARMVFDPHRLEAYIELGETEKAIPMLDASAKAFPDDYNPPARLARAYMELKRYDEALAASDRALAMVYGPRKLRVLSERAEILSRKGDKAGAAATLKEAILLTRTLPLPDRFTKAREGFEKRLAELR
jgi:tetratricopeptide (TPR) repeat protein